MPVQVLLSFPVVCSPCRNSTRSEGATDIDIKPWADSVGKPIIIGEFGAKEAYTLTDRAGNTITISTEQAFADRLDAIVKNKIQLSALWVFDFDEQNETSGEFWNCTFSNSRSYMLDAIIEANNSFKNQ